MKDFDKKKFDEKESKDCSTQSDKRKKFNKGKRGRGSETTKDMDRKVAHFNDPSWYASNPALLNSAANVSFPVFAGKPIIIDPDNLYPASHLNDEYPLNGPMPGGMVLNYHTLPGIARTGTDAINVAARNIYQFVRHANAGHANYEPQDYMLYLLAMDSLYAYYAWMIRIYGIAQSYSLTNRYIPKALLTAINVDCDDIQANGNDFLYAINNAARKINSLAVPSGMSYYARHIWLNSHVWADDNTTKAQFYMYNPTGFYKYDEVGVNTGGKLTYVRLKELTGQNTRPFGVSDIVTGFNNLFDAIINSEDCGIMMGDTLKAFGGNIAQVSPVNADYQVYAEYSEEVLEQIHNIETTGTLSSEDVEQDPNTNMLKCQPICPISAMGELNHLLDCKRENPDSATILVDTRLKPVISGEAGNGTVDACGSEVVEDVATFRFKYDEFGECTQQMDKFSLSGVLSTTGTNVAEMVTSLTRRCAELTKLDWHPYLYLFVKDKQTEGEPTYSGGVIGDCFNATPLTDETLTKMHDLAILSMFNVPSMGEFAISK